MDIINRYPVSFEKKVETYIPMHINLKYVSIKAIIKTNTIIQRINYI